MVERERLEPLTPACTDDDRIHAVRVSVWIYTAPAERRKHHESDRPMRGCDQRTARWPLAASRTGVHTCPADPLLRGLRAPCGSIANVGHRWPYLAYNWTPRDLLLAQASYSAINMRIQGVAFWPIGYAQGAWAERVHAVSRTESWYEMRNRRYGRRPRERYACRTARHAGGHAHRT